MFNQRLPEFNQVSASRTSQLRIPAYDLTLKRLQLRLGGTTFTKALITEIRLKLASKTIYTVSGTDLDRINKYRGIFDETNHLSVDFSDRDAKDIVAEEIGGIDLSKLNDALYLEVDIGAATAPTLYCMAFFTPPQGDAADPRQLIKKLVKMTFNAAIAGNKNSLPFDPKGAIVQRAFFSYTGTDWTATADGNLRLVEVKKNGLTVSELGCYDSRFVQQEYRKVPQSRLYVADFIVDNNLSGALVTDDAKALEWNLYPTAADVVTAYFEVLDKPYNL